MSHRVIPIAIGIVSRCGIVEISLTSEIGCDMIFIIPQKITRPDIERVCEFSQSKNSTI